MSLLNPQTTEPTITQKQDRVAQRIRQVASQNYAQLVRMQKEGIQIVWHNPQGLTPQQVCDAIGADAAKSFELHGKLTEAVIDIATVGGVIPDIELPTNAFTRNPDGSVTVLESPYTP